MFREELTVNVFGIAEESIVDGPGLRYSIFCQGCPHDCLGCHNPESHVFEERTRYTLRQILEEVKENPLLSGVTFSGGDPVCQAEAFAELGEMIKAETALDVTCFTGYTYEQLLWMAGADQAVERLLGVVDLLVDGPYVQALRDLTQQFKGSTNQRLIDLKAMREAGDLQTVILWEER